MANKCSTGILGGTLKMSRFDRLFSGAATVFALLLTLALISCAGGSSSKIVSDDESDGSSESGWTTSDSTGYAEEELDLTDTDGDGVPDFIEEPYGTEENPFEYPDVYSQLEDDPAFEDDGYPDASDYIDLATSAGTAVASYMLARGIAKNTPLCVTPTGGVGNIISLDQEALASAGIMTAATSTISFTAGGTYTRKVYSGTDLSDPTGIDLGTYTISKGQILLRETGLTCMELYKASITESACTTCTTKIVEVPAHEIVNSCTVTVATESNGDVHEAWADPIAVTSLSYLTMLGTDVQTAAQYDYLYKNTVPSIPSAKCDSKTPPDVRRTAGN
jgi:hypothetical protein